MNSTFCASVWSLWTPCLWGDCRNFCLPPRALPSPLPSLSQGNDARRRGQGPSPLFSPFCSVMGDDFFHCMNIGAQPKVHWNTYFSFWCKPQQKSRCSPKHRGFHLAQQKSQVRRKDDLLWSPPSCKTLYNGWCHEVLRELLKNREREDCTNIVSSKTGLWTGNRRLW